MDKLKQDSLEKLSYNQLNFIQKTSDQYFKSMPIINEHLKSIKCKRFWYIKTFKNFEKIELICCPKSIELEVDKWDNRLWKESPFYLTDGIDINFYTSDIKNYYSNKELINSHITKYHNDTEVLIIEDKSLLSTGRFFFEFDKSQIKTNLVSLIKYLHRFSLFIGHINRDYNMPTIYNHDHFLKYYQLRNSEKSEKITSLTSTEYKYAILIKDRFSNKEISEILTRSVRTV
ncbi:helix-turn-helix transcriptional regulator, partial [Piscirickettsia litoralis]|uniref:helix-turn-helix transcriptional regulator n=1 Tax=Piscirickettsia litoralis TaxID=1891921 RepID=UPI00130141F8